MARVCFTQNLAWLVLVYRHGLDVDDGGARLAMASTTGNRFS